MKLESNKLIADLIDRTKENLNSAEGIKQLSFEKLNWKMNAESWSALECFAHLNLYGDFYLPEIETRIYSAKYAKAVPLFKSGLLGNYFAKAMLPKEKLNKMSTFKDKNPVGSNLTRSVLDKFIAQQKLMLELLDQARNIDLNRTKTSISISKFIKLKLGDTFRVVIYHNQRHIVQAKKAIALAQN